MTATTTIPLNKLLAWDGNVRKTGASQALDELIASIAAHGLLQSLVVREAPAKGKTKGKYHIVAGQRRYMALTELAKRGTIPADHEIPCHVLTDAAQATEISLAENTVRLPMHPADQFEAFHALNENGLPVPDIAARFGVAESTVHKLLKLARVSPAILGAYREDRLTLAQVQAFACTDDQTAQEQLFHDIDPDHADPQDIRDALRADTEIPATDKRVRYVGLSAYEKAGGTTRRDLFTEGDSGITTLDPELLNDLAVKKLSKSEKTIRAEGWAWVEINPDLPWDIRHACTRIHEQQAPLPAEQQAEYDALTLELDTLTAMGETDDPDTEARIADIESRIEAFDDRPWTYRSEEIAIAGVFITLDRDGEIDIERGYVRPEDASRLRALRNPASAASVTNADQSAPSKQPFSATLIESLTAHRSAAIAATLACNPAVALAATVHTLAIPVFFGHGTPTSLRISASPQRRTTVQETLACTQLDREESIWRDRIPGDIAHFLTWCLAQDTDTLLALLAYCAATAIDATQRKQDRPQSSRLQHAVHLAQALQLDMTAHFKPDASNYFSKIGKSQIIADLTEVKGVAAPAWTTMKKADLAQLAAREMAQTAWLPQPLRQQEPAST